MRTTSTRHSTAPGTGRAPSVGIIAVALAVLMAVTAALIGCGSAPLPQRTGAPANAPLNDATRKLCEIANRNAAGAPVSEGDALDMVSQSQAVGVPQPVRYAVEDFHAARVAGSVPAGGRASVRAVVEACRDAGWRASMPTTTAATPKPSASKPATSKPPATTRPPAGRSTAPRR